MKSSIEGKVNWKKTYCQFFFSIATDLVDSTSSHAQKLRHMTNMGDLQHQLHSHRNPGLFLDLFCTFRSISLPPWAFSDPSTTWSSPYQPRHPHLQHCKSISNSNKSKFEQMIVTINYCARHFINEPNFVRDTIFMHCDLYKYLIQIHYQLMFILLLFSYQINILCFYSVYLSYYFRFEQSCICLII